MAKKKAGTPKTAAMQAESHGGSDGFSSRRDALQASANKQLTTIFGAGRILNHADAMARCGGIALPSLCLRYLFCQDAFTMSRILTLAGAFRSCKTALAIEISRWIVKYGGFGHYFSVESKDPPSLRAAIFRNDLTEIDYLQPVFCESQEQWQGGVSNDVEKFTGGKGAAGDVLGVGIVDSVAAAKPQKEREKFLTEKGGAGARGYASIALLNGDWVTHITSRIAQSPYICILIQHSSETPVEGMPGVTKVTHKGGGEIGFAKTTALEMKRVKDIKETGDGRGGMDIKLVCSKNSLGPTNRSIIVPARWGYIVDPKTGQREQHFIWDWHAATMALLISFQTAEGKKTLFKDICKVCDLHPCKAKTVWSRSLGIPESSPVSYGEAGAILEHEHPELLPELYKLLGIERRSILEPGGDLYKMWAGKVPILDTPKPVPYPRATADFGAVDDDDE